MALSETSRRALQRSLDILTFLGGIVLLAAVSWEIVLGNPRHFAHWYMAVQFIVCVLFLLDFFVRLAASNQRWHFFVRNILFFIISVPYLNIIGWAHLPREVAMLIGIMPLLRTFLALYVLVRWLVVNRVERLMATYVFTVVLFTYISALVFYDYEIGINSQVHNFGDALWWAGMNVTTVGAQIFPVTAIGKILSVLLPMLGMMMFPIFTTYVMSFYQNHKRSEKKEE